MLVRVPGTQVVNKLCNARFLKNTAWINYINEFMVQ